MALGKKRRRELKIPPVKDVEVEQVASSVPIEEMEITFKGNTARFWRLKYKGVPQTCIRKEGGVWFNKRDSENLVEIKREDFIRKMYGVFSRESTHSQTGYKRFTFLCRYVSYLDENRLSAGFDKERVESYCNHRVQEVTNGRNKNSWQTERALLRSILIDLGLNELADNIPSVKKRRDDEQRTEALSDSEFSKTAKRLLIGFSVYVELLKSGQRPLERQCPLFSEELALQAGMTEQQIYRKTGLRWVSTGPNWTNALVKLAMMIIALWTGANLGPLNELRRKDCYEFKRVGGNCFQLDSTKARAFYAKQMLGVGFTKRAREFIELWLDLSEKIDPSPNAFLFPKKDEHGNILNSLTRYKNPHRRINWKLQAMGLSPINTRILRATRSNIVQRAFENIFITAAANRNSVAVTSQSYSEGVKSDEERKLAMTFDVMHRMSQGTDKQRAIQEATYTFRDPFTVDEWQQKKDAALATRTPTGARCMSPFGEKSKQSLRPFRDSGALSEGACISFLDCYECKNHRLVASEDDIWLVLSFRDALNATISLPSINSVPGDLFKKRQSQVNEILALMEKISPEEYRKANDKNKREPHPLYSDEYAIVDLLEIYGL